jgi:light-regulated signal transduction histidine kinase (bacteriophytochrome)
MQELVRAAIAQVESDYKLPQPPSIDIESLPSVRGDQSLLQQVWVNLIDNAVKYSSKVPVPKITIRGREEEDRVVYEVIDNGVGFDSRFADRLFGVFQRLHGANEYPGTGVGLAIVHRVITRHGGKVWGTSQLNAGATFGFSLPRE